MTIRKIIRAREDYPVLYLREPTEWDKGYEFSEEFIERYNRIVAEYEQMQEELDKICQEEAIKNPGQS